MYIIYYLLLLVFLTIYKYEIEALIDDVKKEHHYLSETKKDVIDEVKSNYPHLCTYESEWIYNITIRNEVKTVLKWYSLALDYTTFPIKANTKYLIKWNLNFAPTRIGFLYYDSNNKAQFNGTIYNASFQTSGYVILTSESVDSNEILRFRFDISAPTKQPSGEVMAIEYQEGMENWNIPYFEGEMSVIPSSGQTLQ